MIFEVGILFAFAAMLFWGFGDFLIQRSTRKFGDFETLFIITFIGAIILFPFVYKDIPILFSSFSKELSILLAAGVILFVSALLDFEALKRGKIAVIEPILSLEVPIAALLSYFIFKETLSKSQVFLITSLLIGIILVSLKEHHLKKSSWLEKGVLFVLIGTFFMGLTNFFYGYGSRITNPLLTNFFINVLTASFSIFYIAYTKRTKKMIREFSKNKKLIFSMSFLDNFAWIAISFSMIYIPIAISVAISESYIIIAVLLGLILNKEKIRKRQKIGIFITIVSAIALAAITNSF